MTKFLRSFQLTFSMVCLLICLSSLTACKKSRNDGIGDAARSAENHGGTASATLSDVLVLTVTSDSSGTYELNAVVDENQNVTGVRVINRNKRTLFTLEQLLEGVALYTKTRGIISKDVIRMNVENFSASEGGTVVLTLLRQYRVLGGDDYRTYEMQVGRPEQKDWKATRKIGDQLVLVDGLYFETRTDNGSEVGIESVVARLQDQDLEKINTGQLPQSENRVEILEEASHFHNSCGRFLI